MPTYLRDLRRWFEDGEQQGAAFMLIFCDDFSHDDYPVYCASAVEAHDRKRTSSDRYMECYDISLGWAAQSKPGVMVHNLPLPTIPMPKTLGPLDLERVRNHRYISGGASIVRRGEVEIVFAEGTLIVPRDQFSSLRNMLDAAEDAPSED